MRRRRGVVNTGKGKAAMQHACVYIKLITHPDDGQGGGIFRG